MRRFITQGCVLLAALTMSLMSCTDSQDEVKPAETVKPGVYATDITLYAEQGEDPDINTRGLNTGTGEFTSVYPYDYIYIHSADNNEEDGTHKSLYIPLKEVEYCDECKGIHLEMEVLDNDGRYTIKSSTGKSITLSNSESVYFSTISTPYWEAEVEGATPVTGKDVFVESNANSELLKSANTYTRDELISLIEQDVPVIQMTRHCTGFRVYFMFTHVPANGSTNNVIYDPNTRTDYWEETFPEEENIMPGNFYIKLYLGPNFCHNFDLLNGKAVGDEGGYYATNGQNYQPLEYVNYSFTGGDNSSSYSYNGYGYVTADLHYLISPLNANIDASEFSIYAFVKYSPNANSTDESYLGSDVGSKYFQAQIPDITLTLNRIHYVIMAFDVEDLRKAFIDSSSSTDAKTRSPWEEPEKIELKPVKVICR